MITISEKTARHALKVMVGFSNLGADPELSVAMKEVEDQLKGWKSSLEEIPPHSAIGERFEVLLESGVVYKAILIKCHDNGDDQLFSRLGSHEDDIFFTSQVAYWRYDD